MLIENIEVETLLGLETSMEGGEDSNGDEQRATGIIFQAQNLFRAVAFRNWIIHNIRKRYVWR
jgi:hypothetical protein